MIGRNTVYARMYYKAVENELWSLILYLHAPEMVISGEPTREIQ